VALSNDTPSSAAVLQSLLAFSYHHRYGLQPYASRLKLSALSALAASAKNGVDAHEVIPHVAALMLLCCFEVRMTRIVIFHGTNHSIQVQQASASSSHWLSYISGVKKVLRAARLGSVEWNSDMASLLYWVSYHDVLAQFSLRYWGHCQPAKEKSPRDLEILVQQISFYDVLEVCLEPFFAASCLLII